MTKFKIVFLALIISIASFFNTNLTADPVQQEGVYKVTSEVTDNFGTKKLMEIKGNQPPVIISWEPVVQVFMIHTNPTVNFSVTAEDPDLDDLTYSWWVNEDELGNDSTFSYDFYSGEYEVHVFVSDGEEEVHVGWWFLSHVGIDEENIPTITKLYQNYPNPFNPVTNIKFDLAKDSNVNLIIYNSKGEMVKTIVKNEIKSSGRYSFEFNGNSLPSGIYYYELKAGIYNKRYKAMLVK